MTQSATPPETDAGGLISPALDAYLKEHAGEPRALLEKLVRQPSISAQHTGMEEMLDLVERELRATGFTTERFSIAGAPPMLFGELPGKSPWTLLLYDHYDVQPPEPLELWDSPAFEPTERDGKLYGRGTSDDKGEIAARLAAIRAIRATQGQLPITLKYLIEGEEEIGSAHFAEILRGHEGRVRADAALWEGDGFAEDGRAEMTLGHKGMLYVQLDVTALSHDAHSGQAPKLPSAAWRLVRALASLRDADGRVRIPGFYDAVRQPTSELLAVLRDQMDTDEEVKALYGISEFNGGLHGADLRVQQSFAPTCNIAGLLSGYTGEGMKTVLPAQAMAKIDFRLVPDQDPDEILAKLRAHLEAQGFADVRVSKLGSAAPVMSGLDLPLVQQIAALAQRFTGKPASITPLSGGTLPFLADMRKIGIQGASVPGDPLYYGNGAHAPNEHIRLADLDRAVRWNAALFGGGIGG